MGPNRFYTVRVSGAAGTYSSTVVGELAVHFGGNIPLGGLALATSTQAYAWSSNFGNGPALVELLGSSGTCNVTPATACTVDAQCHGTCVASPCPIGSSSHCCEYGANGTATACVVDTDCVDNCDTAGKQHPVTGIATIEEAVGAGNTVFIRGTDAAGNGTVVSIDVSTFAQSTILAAGDFTLSAISLSSAGELAFAGLRNSDGATVFGRCNPMCTVLNATAPAVTALQRID